MFGYWFLAIGFVRPDGTFETFYPAPVPWYQEKETILLFAKKIMKNKSFLNAFSSDYALLLFCALCTKHLSAYAYLLLCLFKVCSPFNQINIQALK